MPCWIEADWPAPGWIRAGSTTRHTGCSPAPYSGLNLALNVDDKPERVRQNRIALQNQLQLPSIPLWLQQAHGNEVIASEQWSPGVIADGCCTSHCGVVCAVLTADCVPLLLCNNAGTRLAAIHVGWRGLCRHIVDVALSCFDTDPGNILAWLGPHIHASHYAVGEAVRKQCLQALPGTDHAFIRKRAGLWLANLETLVRHQLQGKGITMIYSCNRCTFADQADFFSHRRDKITGRMASLIWMDNQAG